MANIKFFRGLHASILTKLAAKEFPAGSIVFVTDEPIFYLIKADQTGEKFDGNGFNIDDVSVVEKVEKGADGHSLKITYTGEESPKMETITFNLATSEADGLMSKEDKAKLDSLDPNASGAYQSTLDESVATVTALGGIAAGTTVASLNGKSYDEIFDTLIFPTVNPTFTAPSATLALKSYNATQEIGATAPTAADFTATYNAGAITLAGKKQNNRGGVIKEDTSKIYYNNSATLAEKVILGAMPYKYHVEYEQGPQPKDSKGNNYSTPLPAGSVESSVVNVYGTYPYFANGVDASSTNNELDSLPANQNESKLSLKRIDNNTSFAVKFMSEAVNSVKSYLLVPATKKVTAVKAMNALTGKFDVDFTTWEMGTDIETKEVQGVSVNYKRWTTTGSLLGGNQYLFTIANA